MSALRTTLTASSVAMLVAFLSLPSLSNASPTIDFLAGAGAYPTPTIRGHRNVQQQSMCTAETTAVLTCFSQNQGCAGCLPGISSDPFPTCQDLIDASCASFNSCSDCDPCIPALNANLRCGFETDQADLVSCPASTDYDAITFCSPASAPPAEPPCGAETSAVVQCLSQNDPTCSSCLAIPAGPFDTCQDLVDANCDSIASCPQCAPCAEELSASFRCASTAIDPVSCPPATTDVSALQSCPVVETPSSCGFFCDVLGETLGRIFSIIRDFLASFLG